MHPDTSSPINLLVAGCIVVAFLVLLVLRGQRRPALPYRRKPLLTAWERRAMSVMTGQLYPGLHICPQVRLADLLTIFPGDPRIKMRALNRVAMKSIDFIIVDITSGEAVLGIELDDRSHDREDRQQRDAFINAVFQEVGVPLARFRPSQTIDIRPHLAAIGPSAAMERQRDSRSRRSRA